VKILIAIFILLASSISSAATTLLDFETYDTVGTQEPYGPLPGSCVPTSPEPTCLGGEILHKGYVVDFLSGAWYQGSDLSLCTGGEILPYYYCEPVYNGVWKLREASASNFSVISLDVVVDWGHPDYDDDGTGQAYADFHLYGGVESIYKSLTRASMGVSDDFAGVATITLELGWDNIEELGFWDSHGEPISIDNIAVSSVVPIPAAVWLFGSALAGLGWLRRKQST